MFQGLLAGGGNSFSGHHLRRQLSAPESGPHSERLCLTTVSTLLNLARCTCTPSVIVTRHYANKTRCNAFQGV